LKQTKLKDPVSKSYTYADLSSDKHSLVATDAVVGQADPETLGIRKRVRSRRAWAKQLGMSSAMLTQTQSRWQARRKNKKHK
jgi:hypothetical protein